MLEPAILDRPINQVEQFGIAGITSRLGEGATGEGIFVNRRHQSMGATHLDAQLPFLGCAVRFFFIESPKQSIERLTNLGAIHDWN